MKVFLKVDLDSDPISRNTRLQLHNSEWAQIRKYPESSKILYRECFSTKSIVPTHFVCVSDHFFQKNFSREKCMVGDPRICQLNRADLIQFSQKCCCRAEYLLYDINSTCAEKPWPWRIQQRVKHWNPTLWGQHRVAWSHWNPWSCISNLDTNPWFAPIATKMLL